MIVWSATVPATGWAAIRLTGAEPGIRGIQLLAFTPYVAGLALVPLLLACGLRRWWPAALAAVTTVALAGGVLPRGLPDLDRGPIRSGGPTLRVMSSNMLFGGADATRIVALVRDNQVDLLALQEYTVESERALAAAGLGELLRYRAAYPRDGVIGSALYARHPLTEPALRQHAASGFGQAAAVLTVPGAAPVDVESAHPAAPSDPGTEVLWRSDYTDLPGATPDGRLRILLGDFNATLDHATLRRLIATGYRDAADVTGSGLATTWPYDGQRVPPVTIDHVLADRRIGVRTVSTHLVPDADHRAVIATLTLPPGDAG